MILTGCGGIGAQLAAPRSNGQCRSAAGGTGKQLAASERERKKGLENTRELVLDMLMEILEKGSYSHLVIREVLDKYDYWDRRDKAFVKRVTEGTMERLIQIDYCLDQFSSVPVARMKPLIRNLMRMSTFQILFMDKVPDRAVCSEAVKLAGKRGFKGLSGFVNGVLRNLARNREEISYPDREKERTKYLSVKYSMPLWLTELWESAYGEEKTLCMLEGLLKEQPLTVRVRADLTRKQRKKWLDDLKQADISAWEHPYLSCAWILESGEGISSIPGYGEGYFTVQDASSMLVAEAAGLDEIVQLAKERGGQPLAVDVCASPGGKSMHVAEKLAGSGKVIARDLSEYKVSLIRDNIERMKYQNVESQVADARIFDETLEEKADLVLADLPCSGLGVIGKKRDIKYRITEKSLEELAGLQRQILDVVWRYVKPGGVLIYSTCTINPAENEEMVRWFIANHPFKGESLSPFLPQMLKEDGKSGMLQLLPGIHETDGFFLARMRRSS